eukprot:821089-Prymnesium_polylepis.1
MASRHRVAHQRLRRPRRLCLERQQARTAAREQVGAGGSPAGKQARGMRDAHSRARALRAPRTRRAHQRAPQWRGRRAGSARQHARAVGWRRR